MKEKIIKHINYKIVVFNCFIVLFVISFANFKNLDIVRYITLIVLQLLCILNIVKKKVQVNKTNIITMSILIFSMLFSLFKTSDFNESIFKILIVVDLLMFSNVLLPNYLKDIEFNTIINSTLKTIFITLLTLFIFFHNYYVISYDSNRVGNLVRFVCGLNHPNILGIFASLGFMIGIYFIAIKSKKIYKYIMYLLFLGIILLKSGSRTATYVILIFGLLFFKDLLVKNRKVKLLIYLFIILSVITYIIFNEYDLEKINFDTINTLLSYRLTYIQSAIHKLTENNALFIGMGAFRNSMTNEIGSVMLDNGYFNYIYQYGIISFIVLIKMLINNFKIIDYSEESREKKIFVKNLYIVFLIYSFFENILLNISSLFAILIYTFINIISFKEKK